MWLHRYKEVKVDRDDKVKALLVKMPSDMHKLLKVKTAESGENMTTVILKLIEEYLAQTVKKSDF